MAVNALKNNEHLKFLRSSQQLEFKTLLRIRAYLLTYLLARLLIYVFA